MIQIFDEAKRVLKKEGTCWVVLGDTYSGSGDKGNGFDPKNKEGRNGQKISLNKKVNGILSKSLCMIPERFAIKMIDNNWILRNKIIWWKPNCMPSSAKDRFTVDYEYVYFFSKSQKYYFKTQYEPHKKLWDASNGGSLGHTSYKDNEIWHKNYREKCPLPNPNGRIKRCVWSISTKPFPEAHFAVFPEELVKQCLDAGCPSEVCIKCKKPRIQQYHSKTLERYELSKDDPRYRPARYDKKYPDKGMRYAEVTDLGLSDCGCNAGFEDGIVLDPFMGSGTTALVALKHNRNFVGIELNSDYIKIANKRIEPYLLQQKLI